ncbi:transposase [Bacillus sp. LL01]|uniref:REP-associated tyrosine transposase n=1 Tax=Bacillus sp. LL01 TaxID=1665556 RepID=UPI00064D54D4|nr:transposase [Bacillus sp. LL01]KMJ59088.1 transposase [Bacillus sp. LL01]
MPRQARRKSVSRIYHIILRGANKQEIFHDVYDRSRFLEILDRCQRKVDFSLYGWCLMGNHVHLLMKEGEESISNTMRRIGVSYAMYYNTKYQTIGHLFQDRFKSENVEDRRYLMTVIRYIHQNPVKAGLVGKPEEWNWSSCAGYYGSKRQHPWKIVDERFILQLFSEEESKARALFKEFNEERNPYEDECMDPYTPRRKLTDEEARTAIQKVISPMEVPHVKSLPRAQRTRTLLKIKRINGVTQRQAARILGISESLVFKA